jgi:hypothetical protein
VRQLGRGGEAIGCRRSPRSAKRVPYLAFAGFGRGRTAYRRLAHRSSTTRSPKASYDLVLLPGDGIGVEVTAHARRLLEVIEHGSRDWPDGAEARCAAAGAILQKTTGGLISVQRLVRGR